MAQYEAVIDEIICLLEGRDSVIVAGLEARMEEAALRFDFETAAKFRDYLGAVHSLLQKEQVIEFTGANKNIIVLEPVDAQSHKLILIKGSVILYRTLLAREALNEGQLTGRIAASARKSSAAAARLPLRKR